MNKGPYWVKLIVSVIISSVLVPVAWADFGVRTVIEEEYECEGGFKVRQYDDNPCYGNGQALKFKQAVGGGDPLTIEEQNALAAQLPLREYKRYYGRLCLNRGTLSLTRYKNRSTDSNVNLAVTTTSSSTNQTGLEIAFGYIWEPTFWGDLEYLVIRNFNRPAVPIFVGPVFSSPMTIKTSTILANGYYNFIGFSRFEPYVTAGLGLSMYSARANSVFGSTISTQTYSFAIGGGVGLRIGFWKRWYLDFAYRYIYLGPVDVKFSNVPVNFPKITAEYNLSSVRVGLIFLF